MSELKLKVIDNIVIHHVNEYDHNGMGKEFVISTYDRDEKILRVRISIETKSPEEYEGTLRLDINEEELGNGFWTETDSPEYMELGDMVPSWESYGEIKQKEIDNRISWCGESVIDDGVLYDEDGAHYEYDDFSGTELELLKLENSYSQICSMVKRLSRKSLSDEDKKIIFDTLEEVSEKQKEILIKNIGYSILKLETDTVKIKKILDELIVKGIHED